MAQSSRALIDFPEKQSLAPSSRTPVTSAPGDSAPSSGHYRHCTYVLTQRIFKRIEKDRKN